MLPKSGQEGEIKTDPPELPKLPKEVWLNIFKFLDYVSLIKVSNLCRQFNFISKTSWKNRVSAFQNVDHQEVTLDNAASVFKNLMHLELLIAVQSNNVEKVKLMLEENRRYAQTVLRLHDHDGGHTEFYPLVYACSRGYFDIAILLLESGAPADLLIPPSGNLIHLSIFNISDINMVNNQIVRLITLLLKNMNPKIIDTMDENSSTAFYQFMKKLTWNHENAEETLRAIDMVKLFLDRGADPTVKCTFRHVSVLDLAVCKIDPHKIRNPDPVLRLIREYTLRRTIKDEERILSITRLAECGILDVDCDLSSIPTDKLTDSAERIEKLNCAVTTGRRRGGAGYYIKSNEFISAKDLYNKTLHDCLSDDREYYGKFPSDMTRTTVEHAAKAVSDTHIVEFIELLNDLNRDPKQVKGYGKE